MVFNYKKLHIVLHLIIKPVFKIMENYVIIQDNTHGAIYIFIQIVVQLMMDIIVMISNKDGI